MHRRFTLGGMGLRNLSRIQFGGLLKPKMKTQPVPPGMPPMSNPKRPSGPSRPAGPMMERPSGPGPVTPKPLTPQQKIDAMPEDPRPGGPGSPPVARPKAEAQAKLRADTHDQKVQSQREASLAAESAPKPPQPKGQYVDMERKVRIENSQKAIKERGGNPNSVTYW